MTRSTADTRASAPGAEAPGNRAEKASTPRPASIALAAAALLLAAAPAPAGVDRWTEEGPGAPVEWMAMVAADPLLLYAATGCELWRSADAGESWQGRGAIPGCAGSLTVLAAPRAEVLYAGIADPERPLQDPALLRSEDGGRSWRRVLSALVHAVLVPPDRPSLVLAGGRGIFRSADGGASWRQVFPGAVPTPPGGFGIHAYTATSLYLDPGEPSKLVANVTEYITGSLTEDCYVSRDRGRTWTLGGCEFEWLPEPRMSPHACFIAWPFSIACPVNQVIPTPEVPSIPGESLIIVPAEPPVLYASDPEAGQAFRSLDRGRSWSPVPGWTELLPRDPYGSRSPAVLVHPAVPARVFQLAGGLHRATFVGAAPLRAHGGRFETRAAWRLAGWPAGTGLPAAIDERAGTFWFLRPDELELAVKVVDGRAVNGRFWAFQTALTSLEYEVTVTDTVTGLDRTWFNPAGRFAARADTGTLVDPGAPAAAASTADLGSAAAAPAAAAGAVRTASAAIAAPPPLSATPSSSECNPSPAALCLLDRFEVEAYWRAPGGDLRPADAVPLTAATGGFRFGPGGSLQLLVKLLDGRAVNGRFWVFYGGLTDRELEIVVTDRRYDLVRVYASREGELASAGDTSAFLGP